MPIKFLDLAAQNNEIRGRVDAEYQRIHDNTAYVGGPQVAEFETRFAEYLGAKCAVGVGSGTDALRLALLAAGIGPGDEVITTPMTFIATVEAIFQVGATPVFVDVDHDTATISAEAVKRYIEEKSYGTRNGPRAIVPVHLYGLPAAMDPLLEIARTHKLAVIEDACQAHGARVHSDGGWKRAGAVGTIGCFSFYPGKNLGAWGEAGAIATNDSELAERISVLRDHGRVSHYMHRESGYNARMDTVQAAVLLAKLECLDRWNARRREIARHYSELLSGCGVQAPIEPEGAESCYHLFVIRSPRRDLIRDALTAAEIGCGIHYPIPLHLQPACAELGYRSGDFPNSERHAESILSLPMHPHLTDHEVSTVANTVVMALQKQ
ncbi:MAG TPA: DegT/DnrJ/EryC1/StrS family aminotransferase [Candidatus Binataceae bacterium]|jgi:dTDP-4-amino-4,6-dideoxygalactose transaminase|nr:DegT/DnrJ/EryC1/StrS family aminotransferase [Candidatus Binataceae bacterium]